MRHNAISFKSLEFRLRHNKPRLGKREQKIVHLVVQGYRNSDIAKILSTDELTVDHDLNNLFEKLAVSNRLELALYALHDQLIDQPHPQHPGAGSSSSLVGCLRKAWVHLRRKQERYEGTP